LRELPLAMDSDALRHWIREHHLCWDLAPRFEVHGHERTQVGFDLTLIARHPPSEHDAPGCDDCYRHYQTLREIAALVLSEGTPTTQCEFSPFDASHHLRPQTGWAPEVELAIQITHRRDTFGAVDENERIQATHIEEALRRLGARPRVWSDVETFIAHR
jgi:hypothetical protein